MSCPELESDFCRGYPSQEWEEWTHHFFGEVITNKVKGIVEDIVVDFYYNLWLAHCQLYKDTEVNWRGRMKACDYNISD